MPGKLDFKRIRGKDTALLVFSLLLAYGIWLLHNLSQEYAGTARVPVEAWSDIEGHSRTSDNSVVVVARCRATGFEMVRLRRMESGEPRPVYIPSEKLKPISGGEDLYFVSGSEFGDCLAEVFGKSIDIEATLSDSLKFRFPSQTHKKVPVEAVFSSSFKLQYTAAGPLEIWPDSVIVYGDEPHLANIDVIQTERFSLNKLKSGAHGTVALSKVKGIRYSQDQVSYSMDVTRYVEVRTTLPVQAEGVPSDRTLIIYPSSASVVLRCSFPLSHDPFEGVSVCVDYSDFEQSLGGSCLPNVIGLPKGALSCRVDPEVFECAEKLK